MGKKHNKLLYVLVLRKASTILTFWMLFLEADMKIELRMNLKTLHTSIILESSFFFSPVVRLFALDCNLLSNTKMNQRMAPQNNEIAMSIVTSFVILERCIKGKLPICQSYDSFSGYNNSQKLYTGRYRKVNILKIKKVYYLCALQSRVYIVP